MAKKVPPPVVPIKDPTAWILENEFAEFVLMHTNEIVSVFRRDGLLKEAS